MKNNIVVYFLTRSLFLGGAISILMAKSLMDSYIAVILGTLLGIIIIYIITHINININNTKLLFKIIYFLYLIYLIFILFNILSTFIYSYLLPKTNVILFSTPFILLIIMNSKSIKYINYVANILLVISLVMVLINVLLLSNNFNIINILPILNLPTSSLFIGALIYTIASTAPLLTMVGNLEFKNTLKYYLLSSITLFIVILVISLVMGKSSIIYSYPEYMVLRKINFLNFIENIENFVSITWIFDIFITMSIATLKIKELFNTKSNIIVFIILFIILMITNYFISNNFYNSLIIYKSFILIFSIFILIILIYLIIIKLKKRLK